MSRAIPLLPFWALGGLYKVNFSVLINATDLSRVSSDWLKGRNVEESGRGLF
jgi:hypothetical protein